MTAMPQLVSMFNAVGGGAAALVAVYGYIHDESAPGRRARHHHGLHRARRAHRLGHVHRLADRGGQAAGRHHRPAGDLQGRPGAQRSRSRSIALGAARVHAHHRVAARAAHRGAGRAGVRRADGAADRRRRHAGGDLAAERVHRHRGGDGRVRHRELGADRGRRAGRRVRRHPHQADGRRDEPVARQHHHRRLRHRRRRGRLGGGGRRADPRRSRPTTPPSSSPTPRR